MKPNPTTLYVDDKENFDFVKPMLEQMLGEPEIIHCQTHREAMDYIESDEYADIIFADWDLTGYKFMDSVRHDPENHNTPVIIMSEDTTIQHIVLNKIDRAGTYFLPKPFLERGLVTTYDQVLRGIERRRKFRIKPVCDIFLEVQFNGYLKRTLPLVDFSIDGCLLRAPVDISHEIKIYDDAHVWLKIDEFDMQIDGEVFRIGADLTYPESKESALIMVSFDPTKKDSREFIDLVDDLGKRWMSAAECSA